MPMPTGEELCEHCQNRCWVHELRRGILYCESGAKSSLGAEWVEMVYLTLGKPVPRTTMTAAAKERNGNK